MLQRILQREEGSRLQRWLLPCFSLLLPIPLPCILSPENAWSSYNNNNTTTQNPTPVFSSACGFLIRIMFPAQAYLDSCFGGPLLFTLAFAPTLALFLSLLQQNASPKQLKGDKVQLTHRFRVHSIMVRQSQAAGACSSSSPHIHNQEPAKEAC